MVDPELKRLLTHIPRIGLIFPGKPTLKDGKPVIDWNPPEYLALGGRFKSTPEDPATEVEGSKGKYMSLGNFAYNAFMGKPVYVVGDAAKYRVEHNNGQRNWLLGHFVLPQTDDLPLVAFEARYVSGDLGENTLGDATLVLADADPVQSALLTTDVGVTDTWDSPAEFRREMAPPPAPAPAPTVSPVTPPAAAN